MPWLRPVRGQPVRGSLVGRQTVRRRLHWRVHANSLAINNQLTGGKNVRRFFRTTTVALAFMLCMTMLAMSGTAFAERCVDNGDETVTDNGTGLMWQKATVGPMKWDQAMGYASNLHLGGHSGWGLPSKDELVGLYNSPCKDVMDVRMEWYWSSTTHAHSTSFPWLVNFRYGNDGVDHTSLFWVGPIQYIEII